jgi:hypothetical protein
MKAWIAATILPLLVLGATTLMAAARYGDAVLERGEMVVLREGRRLSFNTPNETIPINEEDLIRLRDNSQVKLQSREKATLTLGSNAVFQVKPWQSGEEKGVARVLFGRFRAAVVGLVGGERFNVKTATATIGVKGTEYRTMVTTQGSTLLVVSENVVSIAASPAEDVHENQLSVVLPGGHPTPPSPVPPEVQQQFGVSNLDSPDPTSNLALNFPGEDGLLKAGIISTQQLENSKKESPPPGEERKSQQQLPPSGLDEAKENLFRGNLRITF